MTANPDALTHDHVYLAADHDRLGRRTLAVVLLTAATMAAEIAAGLWTGSMALLADGLHMATHAGVLGLAAAAYAFARARARDPSFAFGTGKVGDLAGFASALTLGIVALGVAAESLGRLWAVRGAAGGARVLDCHVWRIGPGAHAAVLSVEGPAATEALRRAVAAVPGVAHVTVEVRAGEGRG